MLYPADTICAIATPLGESAIGLIRISGSLAFELASKIFKPPKPKDIKTQRSFSVHYGHIVDPETQATIDEVLLMLYRAPYTYTKEDIVEISCHGGIMAVRRTLELLLRYGARLAEPGEFTKRAFLNGRIDLSQAEAILDVVRAKTDASLSLAMQQLQGRLSQKIKALRSSLLDTIAYLEVSIDMPEEELPILSKPELQARLEDALLQINNILSTADCGKIIREGLNAVIVGKPNVGKSSLLNAILGEARAMVTPIPGTTRDYIEELTNIKGIPIKAIDTAGLRQDTSDSIDLLSMERTKSKLETADLILLVIDASQELTTEDMQIISEVDSYNKPTIIVLNKMDLGKVVSFAGQTEAKLGRLSNSPLVYTSAIYNQGIDELEAAILDLVFSGDIVSAEAIWVSNLRHKEALMRSREHLTCALDGLKANLPEDILCIDIRAAIEELGEITGEKFTEDLLDKIFSQFCVGK